jgi:LAO/AO transport system kinase
VPESGDAVQAMKSGLMEIADFFVLNKSDREGAEQAVRAIKTILTFRITHAEHEWIPDVVQTVASSGKGIDEVIAEINRHHEHLGTTNTLVSKRRKRDHERIIELVEDLLRVNFWTTEREKALDKKLDEVTGHTISSYEAAKELVSEFAVKK